MKQSIFHVSIYEMIENHRKYYFLTEFSKRFSTIEKAKEYYKMCIEDGMVEAKNNLAGLYFEEENYEKAKSLYTEAIENGCKESFENLGDLYYKLDEKEKALSFYLRRSDSLGCQIKIGNIYEVLIEEQIEHNVYIGRTQGDAEEIDSIVYVKSENKLNIGDFVDVKITSALEYDLMGEIVNELA